MFSSIKLNGLKSVIDCFDVLSKHTKKEKKLICLILFDDYFYALLYCEEF